MSRQLCRSRTAKRPDSFLPCPDECSSSRFTTCPSAPMAGCLVIGAASRASRFPAPAFPSHAAGCRVFSRGIRRHAPYVPSFPGFLGRHCVGYRGLLRFPKACSARGVVGGYYRIMPLSFSDGAKRLHRQKGCAERARGRMRPWGKET